MSGAARAQHELARIDAALDRIEAGTFGLCLDCSRPIPLDRLEANPAECFCGRCNGIRAKRPD